MARTTQQISTPLQEQVELPLHYWPPRQVSSDVRPKSCGASIIAQLASSYSGIAWGGAEEFDCGQGPVANDPVQWFRLADCP